MLNEIVFVKHGTYQKKLQVGKSFDYNLSPVELGALKSSYHSVFATHEVPHSF